MSLTLCVGHRTQKDVTSALGFARLLRPRSTCDGGGQSGVVAAKLAPHIPLHEVH